MKDSRAPPDPPGRVRTQGGESGGDSEIVEVGRTYRHQLPSAREQGLASSSFDWGASSFTSTLDVDAIKLSEPSGGVGPTKAPLTTIAPDWEEAVLPPMPNLAAERTLPKLEPAVDSSSESESEGCSASDSESGSNEGSSSSSCSSLESDSSSENDDDSSKVDPPRLTRKARSSSRSRAPRTSSRGARASPTSSRAARASPTSSRNPRESPTSIRPAHASPTSHRVSPTISSRAVRASPSHQLPSQSCSTSPPPRLSASSSRRSRQGSGSSKRHSNILLKKSSLLCQKSDYGGKGEEMSGSSPERNVSGAREEDDSFLKSCKIAEIFHRPTHSSPLPRLSDKVKKRSSHPIHISEEPPREEDVSPMEDSAEEMPQLFDFSEEPAMPILDNPANELNRAISSIRPERMDDLDLGDIITDLAANSNDSDDSCMIVEPPPIIVEQKSLPKPDADDMKYNHKRNMIFGIYGKSQDKSSHKMVKETKSIFDVDESEGSIAVKVSSEEEDEELSSGSESDSTSSSSSCSELLSPLQVDDLEDSHGEKKPNLQCSNPPTSPESSDSSDSESSSSGPGTPPPTLAPEIPDSPLSSHSSRHRELKPLKRQDRPKVSKNKRKVEMASQTDFSPSMPLVHHISGGATPPMLIGFGMEPSKLNRGRPRKNPPMLEPEISSLSGLKREEQDEMEMEEEREPPLEDYSSSQGSKKKKGKLSVFFSAAKHWQKQQEKSNRRTEDNIYDFNDEEPEGSSEEPNEEVCDNRKHSKAAKSKLLKVRNKHKEGHHRKRRESQQKSHKVKNIHSHHLSERKRVKKQRKIVISSDDDEDDKEKEGDEVKAKRSHKGKRERRVSNVAKSDDCTQCHTVPHLANNKQEPVSDGEPARSQKATEPAVQVKKTVIKKERKTLDAVQPVFELFGTSNNFADIGSTPGLIFSKKFCSLKPDTFWKEGGLKLIEEPTLKSEPLSSTSSQQQQESKGSTFTTKASVKEMPSNGSSQSFPPAFVPKNQVQQMASLLASLDSLEKVAGKKSKKEGRKHSKREKEAKKSSEDGVSRGAYETCYETQSEDEEGGGGKKKKKGWKSKHKNVIDPVFLGELEHLIQDISCCQLELKLSTDLWPDRPSDCVPSIFRRRKIQTPTKRRKDSSGKVTKRAKAQKQGSQQQQAEVAILDLTESDEQRLPLKKRHHHLQAEGKEGKGVAEKRIVGTLQVKSPEKICREFRISSKVRAEESAESCLSPSKMVPPNEMRSQASGKNIQEKLLKKPTAADRIVEKLGIQIKKESFEINNESKLGRPGKVSDRTSRRISKELDFTKPESSPARNTNTQQASFAPVVKHESKTKSFTESTFVDSIQDCIEKYTNAPSGASEKPKLQVGGGSRESMSKASQNLSQKFSQKQQKAQGDPPEGNYVTLFSSPEHEVNITSGRNSSMSQSSTSSDSCSIINLDPEPEVTKSRMGRASSRQDLHSHLWKQDEPSQPPSSSTSSSTSSTVTSKAAAYRSLVSETMRKRGLDPTSRPQTSSTKPLPTEPIRRVDLVQGYCHKPLDKSGRPLSGQECLIRKVPQAIVAPFRRNPPEPPMAPVVPIHRASIAAHTTAAEALLNATTSLTASLPPIAPPASAPPAPPTPATPLPTPAQSPPKESPASPASSCKKRGEEQMAKDKEKESEKEDSAATIVGSAPPEHPKTRSKLELEAKLENTKKEAKIKRCKVAVERLNENISRRALLGVSSLEKRVADLQVTETERSRRRRGSVETEAESGLVSESERSRRRQVLAESEVEKRVADLQVSENTDRSRRRRGSVEVSDCKSDKSVKGDLVPELCVTKQLEVLERSRQSLENCDNGGKMGSSPAEPTPAGEKKENDGRGSESSSHKLEKISDKPELTQSSPAVLGTEDRNEGEEEKLSLEKHSEVVRKRRRKTNKTGFPSTMKKKRRIEHENSRQHWAEKVSAVVGGVQLSITGGGRACQKREVTESRLEKREVTESRTETELRLEEAETRQTSTGRPLRECREKVEERLPEEKENCDVGVRGRKRLGDLGLARGRPSKKLKGVKLAQASFRHSNSSSFDPSPASSDVESIDFRSFLDDESDGDSLSVLPSSEDNFLSPSVAQSSEVHLEERKKKVKQSNLLKKSFLNAGLFSYDFKKIGAAPKMTGDNSQMMRGKGLMYRPEEHPFGLLPPPYYCGRQLRQKKEDFSLPHDIWHLHATDSLPTRDIIASWNYKKIKNNIYSTDGRYMQSFETPNCHCSVPQNEEEMGCADKCLNRMTYTECDPDSCHLKNRCSNQSIQKHASTTVLRRFMTPHKGWGVKTKSKIKKDTFIMEYLGEVVTDKEFKQRMHTDYKQDSHHYCLHVGEGMVIDGHRMGGECRFVNHSCKPNCEMQKWSVNGMYRMALFSSREIHSDEELTYDYNFSLFNPHEGQTCHCGNEECRGVIGGKGRKSAAKTPTKAPKMKEKKAGEEGKKEGRAAVEKMDETKVKTEELRSHFAPMKPMSGTQKTFCRTHSVLLLRNLEKIRRLRELYLTRGPTALATLRGQGQRPSEKRKAETQQQQQQQAPLNGYSEEVFKAGLAALTTMRSVTTRRLASAQENPDVSKVVQIARTFQQILASLEEIKTEDGNVVRSSFDSVPSREDLPGYHLKISEPIDFGIIEKNLSSGSYHSVAHIDQDILLLFQNNLRFYGSLGTQGKQAMMLREKYMELCEAQKVSLTEVVGEEGVRCLTRPAIPKTDDEEDVICCPCNQFKDEGVMVQCDACQCWQHTDCVAVDLDPSKLDEFTCKRCSGEKPKLDIPLVPQPEFASPGELHFVSMAREDNLHVTLGMTVYVLRAFKERHTEGDSKVGNGLSPDKIILGPGGIPHKAISPIKGPSKQAASLLSGQYPTYRTVDPTLVNSNDMDIFRVERLWVNEAGHKFAFGFHYLRPHETFHEPSRRFFDNEVFRVPLYEVLPLDTIWSECWVTDPITFCRGRSLAAKEEDVYICEYRVDKTARLFNKISKPKYPTCTKSYAFHNFDLRLKVTRSYTPHEVPDKFKSWRGREAVRDSPGGSRDQTPGRETTKSRDQTPEGELKSRGNRAKQKQAPLQRDVNKVRRGPPLESVLQKLLSAQQDSNPEDASGLLENLTRKRKRVGPSPSTT